MCVRQSIFYVCVTCCDLDVTIRESERRREGRTTTSLVCTIQKKRRNKIRNLWLWLLCCSLLPTCNFHHRPFTSGADEQDWEDGSQITSRPTTDEPLTVTAREVRGRATQMNISVFCAIYVRCWCVQIALPMDSRTISGSC